MSTYPLELPIELLEEAQKLATENQIPLAQWLMSAISAKIEAEKARTLLASYAQNADYTQFDAILARVPEGPPIKGDEL
jgi:hypothetical protein